MKFIFTKANIVKGGLIYTIGDSIAALISNEFTIFRMLGVLIIGATIYAFEIPNYFSWIDQKIQAKPGILTSFKRAGLAMLYFNPLWIARHMLFILLLKTQYESINISLLKIAFLSFLVNIPISLLANYIIQNNIQFKYRFVASAIFSGLMAIYYALSFHWFS